jgi:NarL family two-component system response regulator LiaR
VIDTNHIRVVILDEQGAARKSWPLFLEKIDGVHLVGVASSIKEAIRQCDQFHPDMLLMNLSMPNTSETAFMEQIGNSYPDIQIVAITDFKDENLIRTALQVGALGCLLNNVSSAQVFVGSEVVL